MLYMTLLLVLNRFWPNVAHKFFLLANETGVRTITLADVTSVTLGGLLRTSLHYFDSSVYCIQPCLIFVHMTMISESS